ncbi:hypothetical protein E2C01_060660 [Portunus trituberculatus]|uniref:Uncharacterized protein n=1 Tax=Portunus trituberculatus TaxID=210409 RepID=A0A5B7H641_PORTR|nr:hypothetical protein [Portunus trituberculatus]
MGCCESGYSGCDSGQRVKAGILSLAGEAQDGGEQETSESLGWLTCYQLQDEGLQEWMWSQSGS